MRRIFFYSLLCLFSIYTLNAQTNKNLNSSEIYNQIQKLNFLGSVLYIGAHPDDENTKLISWFSNQQKAKITYLSLTRGDGGQNLLGPQLKEELGVIRTQELLEARKIDGGEQFFTRAVDFGYSKTPEESLRIWDRDSILSDVVWAIRKFQPDIIINRFDYRTSGTTHGHHTASAMLSFIACDEANNPNFSTNQLKYVKPWKTKRLYFNPSWYFFGSKEKFEEADKSNYTKISIGNYYPLLGKSNQEIAALSRSCHKSQGFGSTGTRGEEFEYLEFLKGNKPKSDDNLFEGIDTSWNRVKNGSAVGSILLKVEKQFDFKNPSASVPDLIKAYNLILKLEDNYWKTTKLLELKKIIEACSGLYIEASTNIPEATLGSSIPLKIEVTNRSSIPMQLVKVTPSSENTFSVEETVLKNNISHTFEAEFNIPNSIDYTNPYWLNAPENHYMHQVDKLENIGTPDVIRQTKVTFFIKIEDTIIPFEKEISYKTNDDIKGEICQPLNIVPIITSTFMEKVLVFKDDASKKVIVKIKSEKEDISGNIKLEVPTNWQVSPPEAPFSLTEKGKETYLTFNIYPSKTPSEAIIKCILTVNDNIYTDEKVEINYPHISNQIILKPSEVKAIKVDLKTINKKIAYIMGAGDDIPKYLTQMGYDVDIIKPEDISPKALYPYDVVLTGIRAYNTVKELADLQDILFDFVKAGKTMVVQYNTTNDLVTENLAPYTLKISKDRVSEENAPVKLISPSNPILNYPNKITPDDFKGWVQEQGLYYPNAWAPSFNPVISSNDENETPKNGGILVSKYGNGYYIYTSLSFFRELPAGVSGAYRLMANILSVGN